MFFISFLIYFVFSEFFFNQELIFFKSWASLVSGMKEDMYGMEHWVWGIDSEVWNMHKRIKLNF